MDDEQDMRRTWSHQFQGKSYGNAVDKAVDYWRENLSKTPLHFRYPDEVVAVGPFPITMRESAINKYNNVDGVWDITIRWY